MAIRQKLAEFVDGRRVNEALHRAVSAIRINFAAEPNAYVVVFPAERLEIPIDLRELSDEPGALVGIVKEPRSTLELMFDLVELQGVLADQIKGMPREFAITAMKSLSEDGQSFAIHDQCDPGDQFAHVFDSGTYHHNYRYVSASLPGTE
jgi:hypothetical protein